MGKMTAYPQILLNAKKTGLETLPEKGENTVAVKSSIFLDKSYQDSRDEIILTKKIFLYTKTCCVRSEYTESYA